MRTAAKAGWPGQSGGLSLRNSKRRPTPEKMRCDRVEHVASQGFQKMVGLAGPDPHDDLCHLPVVDGVGQAIGGLGRFQRRIELNVHLKPAQRPALRRGRAVARLEVDMRQDQSGHCLVFSGCRREQTGLQAAGCARAAASTREAYRRAAHRKCVPGCLS
jgi:hypothetical protein